MTHIVTIGAGLAAFRVAQELRRAGHTGPITLVGAEPHPPYDRPPLSKAVLRGERDDTALEAREFYVEQGIDLRLGVEAIALDTAGRTVTLADGARLRYDELIIATGLAARQIPAIPPMAGVHVLRSLGDSLALRADARDARAAVVVGAGFIGCEVAASLRALGVAVTLVEPQAAPLQNALGAQVGALVGRLHAAEQVDVRCGVGLARVAADAAADCGPDRVGSVELSDGTVLPADLVVVGIGGVPVTDWLAGSGVQVDDGVACDEVGRTSADNVWALGDVASWRVGDRNTRSEHWSNVGDQAKALVAALLDPTSAGTATPAVPGVPYFWSDQYDLKIQSLGDPAAADEVHIVEDDGRRFLAYYARDGRLCAVVGAGQGRAVMRSRANIAAAADIAELLAPASAPA